MLSSEAESAPPAFLKLWIPRIPAAKNLVAYATSSELSIDLRERGITLTGQGFWSQYKLHDMVYHTPSEHTLEGKRYPVERQLIFKPSDVEALQQIHGRIPQIIISELYEVGSEDLMIQSMQKAGLVSNDMGSGSEIQLDLSFRPSFNFLKEEFFVYPGSETVPPCQEVVTWHVSAKVRTLSSTQLSLIKDIIKGLTSTHTNGYPSKNKIPSDPLTDKGNARELQELNNRSIKKQRFYSLD